MHYNYFVVKSVKNGVMYEAGPPNASFPVVHVFGNPYEVGFALGTLQTKAIQEFIAKTWTYLINLVVEDMPEGMFPPFVRDMVISHGMERALDWCAKTTADYTPQAYFDEMRGISDATGISYDMILRLNLYVINYDQKKSVL